MGFSKEKKEVIKKYILERIRDKESPYEKTLAMFKVSRQTVTKYLSELEQQNLITSSGGKTKKKYELKYIVEIQETFKNLKELDEQTIYEKVIKDRLTDKKENVRNIIHYAFTEMVNNAIDHSGSEELKIRYDETYFDIGIVIWDSGIGIFKKIMLDHNLKNEDEAIFELGKGKLTSDKQRHSGEGIFFTSRAVDSFIIFSGKKVFHSPDSNKDVLEEHRMSDLNGTIVCLDINKESETNLTELFSKYSDEEYNFSKTEIRIKLAEQYSDSLMSRSQAKRILSRIEKFKEVVLDFDEVKIIGQGFADEIFRIFMHEHPNIKVHCINCNSEVKFMIQRAKKTIL